MRHMFHIQKDSLHMSNIQTYKQTIFKKMCAVNKMIIEKKPRSRIFIVDEFQ